VNGQPSKLAKADLEWATRVGNPAQTAAGHAEDIKALAYDGETDLLYVFSTACCTTPPPPPAAFRLGRDDDMTFSPASPSTFQVPTVGNPPVSVGIQAAAWSPKDQKLYVVEAESRGSAENRKIKPYDFDANTLGSPVFTAGDIVRGMTFSDNGEKLWLVTAGLRAQRIDTQTWTIDNGYDLAIGGGVGDARAVEVVASPTDGHPQVHIANGETTPTPDLRLAVFDVVLNGAPELLSNASFEDDTNADGRPDVWTQNATFTRALGSAQSPPVNPFHGSYIGKISGTTFSQFTLRQENIPAQAGATYDFFGCARIPTQIDPDFSLIFWVRWIDDKVEPEPDIVVGQARLATHTAATPGWRCFQRSVMAPIGANSLSFRMEVFSLNGTMYLDNMSVRRAP
jgi:hypothetical protein